MKIEEHQKALDEHLRNLNKAIEEGIEENQRNISYNVSQGAVELFSIYMHSLHLIEGSGDQFDHRIFKNKQKIHQKIPLEFPGRDKILTFLNSIELKRNVLCYGKRKPKDNERSRLLHYAEERHLRVSRKGRRNQVRRSYRNIEVIAKQVREKAGYDKRHTEFNTFGIRGKF